MIYNPIFEEEIESKESLKDLKKDIKNRARKEYLKRTFSRVYRMFQDKNSVISKTLNEKKKSK